MCSRKLTDRTRNVQLKLIRTWTNTTKTYTDSANTTETDRHSANTAKTETHSANTTKTEDNQN